MRGKMDSFDSKTINGYYKHQDIDDDAQTTYWEEDLNLDQVSKALCRPKVEWKLNNGKVATFPTRDLDRYKKAWLNFIAAKLLPFNHLSDVTKEWVVLLYAIVSGMFINVRKVIQESICYSIRAPTTGGLTHPSLIFALCQNAGVTAG